MTLVGYLVCVYWIGNNFIDGIGLKQARSSSSSTLGWVKGTYRNMWEEIANELPCFSNLANCFVGDGLEYVLWGRIGGWRFNAFSLRFPV